MDELQELREQMISMKKSLDKYNIITQQLMRNVMRQRTKWVNNLFIAEFITLPLLFLFFFGLCHVLGMSQWITVTFVIAGIIDFLLDYKTLRISPRLINGSDLITLRRKLIRQKEMRRIQFIIMLPLALIWLAWFFIEYFHNDPICHEWLSSSTLLTVEIIAISVSLILSAVVSIVIYRRAQHINDTLIDDIDTSVPSGPDRTGIHES